MLTIYTLIVLLFSIVIHEIAHGSVALKLGDSTAKYAGRLTLNPLKHLDPFGSFILPLLMLLFTAGQGPIFGWAKPVPINPYNFRDQKWGMIKVAISGPAANFLIAIIFGFLIRFFPLPITLSALFNIIIFYNLLWGFFNLVPIPPLDGSHLFFSLFPNLEKYRIFIYQYQFLFIILAVLFMWFLGIPYICEPIFKLITGIPFF